jgi:putative inorganic carbon (HCO3(-)) transporter
MSAPPMRRSRMQSRRTAPALAQAAGAAEAPRVQGVDWSIAYVAFLAYICAIVTYRVPIGTASMTIALLTLPLESRPLRFPTPLRWTLALAGWAIIGWTKTRYPDDVYATVIEFLKVCGVMIVALNVLTTRARLRFFILLFLALFALYPARGTIISYFFLGGGVEGRAAWNFAYANPNDLAGMCLLVTAWAAGLFVTERTPWIRWSAFAGVVLLPFIILLTQSRGAFIALVAIAAFVLRSYWRRPRYIFMAALLVGIAVLAAPDSVWTRLGTLKEVASQDANVKVNDEGSARQRLEIWKVARTIVSENPVFGVGLGAYGQTHYIYAQRPQFDPTARGPRDTHSTYLGIAAQTGIPGLIIFLVIIGVTLRHAERVRKRAAPVRPAAALQLQYLELGLLGFLVAGIWGSYGFLVLTYLHICLIYVCTHLLETRSAVPHRRRRSVPVPSRPRPSAQVVIPGAG